ncbi:hypothetical protein MWU60_08670 [Yoonia sp. F2084L]|uniref:hypothetical protein n=1 Tax=Yoonia sp. F2084L TaxID=2926419 RepID=UPI001FF32A65|nr:hypothetical protein [Yoonia sp. F2084L]MCK0095641.1 hypothetical protein [Yoonia sp. F2084L]
MAIEDRAESAVSYMARENRCEGVFVEDVAGRINLRVVGYQTSRFPSGEDPAPVPQEVALKAVGLTETVQGRLKIVSLRPSDYYQMDTSALLDGTFLWNTEILLALEDPPRGRHLAAIACSVQCAHDAGQAPLYYPIVIGPEQSADREDRAILYVTADVDLSELSVVVREQGSGRTLFEKDSSTGFIPARTSSRFILTDVGADVVDIVIVGETHGGRREVIEARLWPIAGN